MKGKKCFGLFLALSIMLGVSLGVSSGDSSALKHEYLTIPAYQSTYLFTGMPTSSFTSQSFFISWTSANTPNQPTPKRQVVQLPNYSSPYCVYNYKNYYPNYDSNSIQFNFSAVLYDYSGSELNLCRSLYPFGTNAPQSSFPANYQVPEYSVSSIPLTVDPNEAYMYQQLRHNLPYRYSYDHIYLRNKAVSSNGITYSTSLKASDLYEADSSFVPNKFSSMIIPFDPWNESVAGALTLGRNVEFTGVFNFPGVTSESGFSFAPNYISNGTFNIRYTYFNTDTLVYTGGNISCEVTRTYSVLDESSPVMNLSYSCPFVVPSDFSGGTFLYYLNLHSSTNPSDGYIWDTTSDWGWSGAYVITDNDSTPGSVVSQDCQGGNCDSAPGSASSLADGEGEADWFDSLVNLFNFNFINPFAPLFEMFTDNSECASIPIIAGMLNAEDDEYCPWFDSSTRSVLTPVLSIASIMLLFGFLVRWLSSSSGNMFEDQTTHKWGNTQFKQKGGN